MMPYADSLFDRPGALGAVATPCLLYLVIISPALFSQWQRDLRRFVDPEKVELDCITAIEGGNAATRRTSFTKYRGLMYQKDTPERSIIILTAYQVSLHGRFASPRYRQLLTPSHACADRLGSVRFRSPLSISHPQSQRRPTNPVPLCPGWKLLLDY